MGTNEAAKTGSTRKSLFIQPLGGNNQDRIGSNCNLVVAGELTGGGLVGDGVLMDFGVHPARSGPAGWTQRFPDIRHLLKPESPVKLRAIFLSHGHADHDEAVVRYTEAGYALPPVYGDALTLNFLKDKLRGARLPRALWPELRELTSANPVTGVPGFDSITPVRMGHSLTGNGYLARAHGRGAFFSSDFKLDQTTLTPATDITTLQAIGARGEVDVLLVDSTRANQSGHTTPEVQVRDNLKEIAERHPHHRLNMVILGTNTEGIARAGWLAAQSGRVLVHHGTSLEHSLRAMNNSGMGLDALLGHDELEVVSGRTQLAQTLSPSYVLNVLAGANGERGAVFARASREEDNNLQFNAEDVVILSASVLPWNRSKVEGIMAALRRQGVEHIYIAEHDGKPLHASGHEHGGGIVQLAGLLRPTAVIPMHGNSAQRNACAALFNQLGQAPEVIPAVNGNIIELSAAGPTLVGHENRPLIETVIRPFKQPSLKPELKAA